MRLELISRIMVPNELLKCRCQADVAVGQVRHLSTTQDALLHPLLALETAPRSENSRPLLNILQKSRQSIGLTRMTWLITPSCHPTGELTMQQLNTKTVPVNLAAAIQIVSQVIRRRKKHDESPTAAADGTKPQPAMEATQRQPTFN